MKQSKNLLVTVGLILSLVPFAMAALMKLGVPFDGTLQYVFAGINILSILISFMLCCAAVRNAETRTIPAIIGLCVSTLVFVGGVLIVGLGVWAGSKLMS